uniref:Retroviral polymerase SH3-like domain-containing protein n=1 Tax=Oryza meridionalis TaxID=40149 RepID=A0A0E0FBI9_9ORYZ
METIPISINTNTEHSMNASVSTKTFPHVRGARLQGHLTGATKKPPADISVTVDGATQKTANPAYDDWEATDQQVLGFLLSSLTREVLMQVATCDTAAETWSTIKGMYSTHTRARCINTRFALTNMKKGNMTTPEYFAKMKSLGDEMSIAGGRAIDEEELIQYIITGLGEGYSEVISAVCACVEPISVSDLYSQVLNFEARQAIYRGAQEVNLANRGGFSRSGGSSRGRGNPGGGRSRGNPGGGRGRLAHLEEASTRGPSIKCVSKEDTLLLTAGIGMMKTVAINSYGVDTNWYIDMGATDHITGELDKLTIKEKYNGAEQIHTASGAEYKSQVLEKFQEFQAMVERMFDRKILAMQTDWGAVQAATYLINRIPSRVIHNISPLEKLHHQKPDYTSLRVFGCACWPNLHPYNNHKLQFRSKRCVFLGFSNIHKGFKCLVVPTGRVYISRDVVFDETIFPFFELHANAGARLRSEIELLPSDLFCPVYSRGNDQLSNHVTNPLSNNLVDEHELQENNEDQQDA